MTFDTFAVRLTLLGVMGCTATQGPRPAVLEASPPPTPTPTTEAGAAAAPEADPPNTRRVRGDGWTIAVPTDWEDRHEDMSETGAGSGPTWQTPAPPGSPGHRRVLLRTTEGDFSESVAGMVRIYQAGRAQTSVREFTHKGVPSSEVMVSVPAQTRLIRQQMGAFVRNRQALFVTCMGLDAQATSRVCGDVLASVWLGATAEARPSSPPAGRVWLGNRGRYVLVPASWRAVTDPSLLQGSSLSWRSNDGLATRLHFVDDIQRAPADFLAGIRDDTAAIPTITILRSESVNTRTWTGLILDVMNTQETAPARSFVQWLVPASPGSFYVVHCEGSPDDLAAHPEVCQQILETFALEQRR